MTTWKCTSCGAIDSRVGNADNACCGECGDPEGLEEVKDRMFDDDLLEDAAIDKDYIGEPSLFEVGFWHWLAHKLGWNQGQVITVWDDGHLMMGFKCDKCGCIGGYDKPPRDSFFSHERIDWPNDLWPEPYDPDYMNELKKLPEEDRRKMIMGDPTIDIPDYCVCRVPQRPLIDETWCRDCQGRVQEVKVTDISNYNATVPDRPPFEGRVIDKTDYPCWWIQSSNTGKQYELYEWQFEEL